ncbi:hypothetical protein JCM10212_005938 [Sporobolomyces blumeae]
MPPRRVVSRSNGPAIAQSPAPPPVGFAASSSPAATAERPSRDADQTGGFIGSINALWKGYQEQTPSRLKLIDGFMLFLMLTGVAQFLYCVAVTNYPFNAFLGGFAATVGQFVLCGALRIQANPENKTTFPTVSPERAFGDFLFGTLVLHFFVWNYLG